MSILDRLIVTPLLSLCMSRSSRRMTVLIAVLALLGTTGGDAVALPQGLSLSLAPTIDYVTWDRQVGFGMSRCTEDGCP